jgi:putative glutamine amidotransferase
VKRAVLCYRFEKKSAPYADALRAVGVEPVFAVPGAAPDSVDGLGLVLSGGTDVDPEIYGQVRHRRVGWPDRERDEMELRFLREALETDVPVLAICRGMQLFNVAHGGGTLLQHIDGHRAAHDVCVEDGNRLARAFTPGSLAVNSRHHQAVDRVGEGLIVTARSADGIVEALERPDRRFAVAVQWHPEDLPAHACLFAAFAGAL